MTQPPTRKRSPRTNQLRNQPGESEPPGSQSESPSRGQPPSRDGSEAAAAAVSGTGSSAADIFSDPGPEFDARKAPPAPAPEDEPDVLAEQWSEEQIRGILTVQGNLTHALLKVGAEDTDTWKHTEDDLKTIAPPMTRILNRYDVTRAAAAAGDEILLGTAVFTYATRNYTRRRRLLAAQLDAGPRPVSGEPAPEETGPEHDEEWQRVHQEAPPALTPKGKR